MGAMSCIGSTWSTIPVAIAASGIWRLSALAGDCAMPVGVRTVLDGDTIALHAILFGKENTAPVQATCTGPACDPELVARELFAQLEQPGA